MAATCAPPLVATLPTEKLELRSRELDVGGGAARHGIELVCKKSSGPFFRKLNERNRPVGCGESHDLWMMMVIIRVVRFTSCLVGGGARTEP